MWLQTNAMGNASVSYSKVSELPFCRCEIVGGLVCCMAFNILRLDNTVEQPVKRRSKGDLKDRWFSKEMYESGHYERFLE